MVHHVLILAAGKGSRLKNSYIPKQFLEIDGIPILMHSMMAFKKALPGCYLYVALDQEYKLKWRTICDKYNFNIEHVTYLGGENRFQSVLMGLQKIKDFSPQNVYSKKDVTEHIVSIHDGARPFADKNFILELIHAINSRDVSCTIPVINSKNSLLKKIKNLEYKSVNRDDFLLAQTPQCFKFKDINEAYKHFQSYPDTFNDDFSVFDLYYNVVKKTELKDCGLTVKYVTGRDYNIKITTDLDYFVAPKILEFLKTHK